jgi:hypothetical protein
MAPTAATWVREPETVNSRLDTAAAVAEARNRAGDHVAVAGSRSIPIFQLRGVQR